MNQWIKWINITLLLVFTTLQQMRGNVLMDKKNKQKKLSATQKELNQEQIAFNFTCDVLLDSISVCQLQRLQQNKCIEVRIHWSHFLLTGEKKMQHQSCSKKCKRITLNGRSLQFAMSATAHLTIFILAKAFADTLSSNCMLFCKFSNFLLCV